MVVLGLRLLWVVRRENILNVGRGELLCRELYQQMQKVVGVCFAKTCKKKREKMGRCYSTRQLESGLRDVNLQ